jgi:uncharacterized membrane protein YqjE
MSGMDNFSPTLGQMVDASRRVAQHSLDIGANRIELLVVELQEERQRLLHSIVLALGAAALALLAGVAFTLGIMVLLWEHSPLLALGILTLLYVGGAAYLGARLVQLQKGWHMFAATLNQLQKDRECFAASLQ